MSKYIDSEAGSFGPFNLVDVAPANDRLIADGTQYCFDVIGNYTIAERAPPPSAVIMPTEAEYTAALQSMLDTEAQTRQYDGILSLCSYAADPDPVFGAEGMAGVIYRSGTWAKSKLVMGQVMTGEIPQPTIPELLAMMPAMVWP